MGYDANIKSARSERRQHLVVLTALLALTASFFLVVALLKPSPAKKSAGPNKEKTGLEKAAARASAKIKKIKAKRSNAGKNLRVGDRGNEVPFPVAKSDAGVAPEKNPLPVKSEDEAAAVRADLETQVREIKATGVIMEADDKSLELTGRLQAATRELIAVRYGDFGKKNFRVRLDLEFQPTIPDFAEKGKEGTLLIELAPISLIPCSVYNFLEIARTWSKGAFHRNANHVLQAIARSGVTRRMPFQEYSKEYPHKKGTVGYAGRPSGPEFYVSIQDNTLAHGPGSQQQHNKYEADCIIGTVIQGMEDGTVDRIHTMPGKEFLGDKAKWVLIRRMHILVPGDGPDGYVEFSSSPNVIPTD